MKRTYHSVGRDRQPRRPDRYRPHLLTLEERLPLGDTVLGLLAGAALLPIGARSVSEGLASLAHASGSDLVGLEDSAYPTTWLTAARQDDVFSGDSHSVLATSEWEPLAAAFAPSAQRHTSPRREQGMDASPLLALRAREEFAFAAPRVLDASAVVSMPRTDMDLLVTLVSLLEPAALARANGVTPTQEAQVKEQFGELPLSFEQNVGQTDASVHFFTRGPGYSMFLTSTEAVMVLNQESGVRDQESEIGHAQETQARSASEGLTSTVVRMQLIGTNATPAVTGREQLSGKVNYFLGNDPAKWHTNIATFGRVEYDDVYPGIDLVWHGSQRQPEYDFVVAPGADPSPIRLRFAGAERVELDAAGDLVLRAGGQEFRQQAPVVYQEAGGQQQEVASRFVLDGGQVRFDVAAYDAGRPLVIDPVLSFSTYLGGSGSDAGRDIVVDPASGDVLLTGETSSPNFPTVNPFQSTYRGNTDAFVTRLRADGTALVYSTYLGGSGDEDRSTLDVDAAGNAYVTGITASLNFPTANALQPTLRGVTDAFVTQLRADGTALAYSTYLGGTGEERAWGVTVDAAGNAYVTGETLSTNFPTVNALQPTNRGSWDAFVAKLSAGGASLAYSTYLGGSDEEQARSIAVDAAGNAYVGGLSMSSNFPIANAWQPTFRGLADAVVAQLSPGGTALVFSTYLGGFSWDYGNAVTVDAAGSVYLVGETWSTNFPTVNAFQPGFGGGNADGFVARLSAGGTALVYSTYLGGSAFGQWEAVGNIAVDAAGNIYVTGQTDSPNFPTANAVQPTYGGGPHDAFVTKLTADGAALIYSTFLGGSAQDYGNAVAVDAAGNAYVVGTTYSANFPIVNALQPTHGGGFADAFVAKISQPDVTPPVVTCAVARELLWPPFLQLVNVGLDVTVLDDTDPNPTLALWVFGNDAADPSDVRNIAPGTLRLRAERRFLGFGRVYLVVALGGDASGNVGFEVCTTVVPRAFTPEAIFAVQAQAAAAAAQFRDTFTLPPGFDFLGEGPPG